MFVDYCTYFNGNQDYFECHEVLEEYWKIEAPGNKEHALVGFVQLATAMYHWRRGNEQGAYRVLNKSLTLLKKNAKSPFFDYLDMQALYEDIELAIQNIHSGQTFISFKIQITNAHLLEVVTQKIKDLTPHDLAYLIDKHKLRDRSAIIAEREANKRSRRH
ncbi:DUF309 domain-containing protein [Solibacillus sp. CAU 1738]